jgi:hypothetical protein
MCSVRVESRVYCTYSMCRDICVCVCVCTGVYQVHTVITHTIMAKDTWSADEIRQIAARVQDGRAYTSDEIADMFAAFGGTLQSASQLRAPPPKNEERIAREAVAPRGNPVQPYHQPSPMWGCPYVQQVRYVHDKQGRVVPRLLHPVAVPYYKVIYPVPIYLRGCGY